ncbi:MAG: ankyrin repeat domain-containing protein [Acidobacteria bacterium]|nr:ankyrin repeat domain-containing protein [Acidobacteriota bacterium]
MSDIKTSDQVSLDELWRLTARALENGDFTWLGELLSSQNTSIVSLLEINGEPEEYMNEAFTWACFEGRTEDAEILLNNGVDPSAGFKTGLAGFHWAVNRGHTETVKMLIERQAPLEQVNMYGGTILNCALYSIVHENKDTHAEIIELLIKAGSKIEKGTLEWWKGQDVSSIEDKRRVAEALAKNTQNL